MPKPHRRHGAMRQACEEACRTLIRAAAALVLATAILTGAGSAAASPGLGSCDLGWYVVEGTALLDGDGAADGAFRARHAAGSGSSHGRVVSLVGDEVAIEGICGRTVATVRHKRRRTKIRATWNECEGVPGKVVLRAAVDAGDCERMRGRVKAKQARPKRTRFTATRSLGNPADCTGEDTFLQLQKQVFGAKGCRVATCHGEFEAGGLDLRYGAAHFALVNQPAATPGAVGKVLVVPGDPDASFLWQKLVGALGDDEGLRMPAAGTPPLGPLELELVRAWILAGAPAAGAVEGAPCLPHARFEEAAPLLPPPDGHQLSFEGPILQPGEEVEGCLWVEAPNTEPFYVGAWEYSMNPGSHHFAVWEHHRGAAPALGEFRAGDVACIGGGAPLDGRTLSGSPEAPYYVDAYPDGIGRLIQPGQILGLNPHYFNEFDVPIQVRVWVNMHPVTGPLQHAVETLFSSLGTLDGKTVFSIHVEPFTVGTLALRMVNTLGTPMRIFHLSSHQHMRGTRFTVWSSSGTKLFENFDWAHPAVLHFKDPLVLEPGDHIDYECEWDNGVQRPVRRCGDAAGDRGCTPGEPIAVRFGLTAQDEMCYVVGFYYTDQ